MERVGDGHLEDGRRCYRRAVSATTGATAREKSTAAPGAWMAKRQTTNRGAAFGRGVLAGAMLVAAYGALYLVQNDKLPPQPMDQWGSGFKTT